MTKVTCYNSQGEQREFAPGEVPPGWYNDPAKARSRAGDLPRAVKAPETTKTPIETLHEPAKKPTHK